MDNVLNIIIVGNTSFVASGIKQALNQFSEQSVLYEFKFIKACANNELSINIVEQARETDSTIVLSSNVVIPSDISSLISKYNIHIANVELDIDKITNYISVLKHSLINTNVNTIGEYLVRKAVTESKENVLPKITNRVLASI